MAPAAKKKPVRQPRKNSNNTNRGGRNARGKNSCKETSPVPFDTHGADADTIHHKEHRYIAHPQLKMLNQSQQQYAGANVYEVCVVCLTLYAKLKQLGKICMMTFLVW